MRLTGDSAPGPAAGRLEPRVGAIGTERIFGRENKVATIGGRELEVAGNSNRTVFRGFCAFAAKNAAPVVYGHRA